MTDSCPVGEALARNAIASRKVMQSKFIAGRGPRGMIRRFGRYRK
jgi:hypothetical protein